MTRLPPGRHRLSREEVRQSQLQRLALAAAESLWESGYGQVTTTVVARRAGVSTATLYRYYEDVWDCLHGAFEAGAERLCDRIEAVCAEASGEREERIAAATGAALALLASEPALGHLLSAEPPPRAEALWGSRRQLVSRLAAMLATPGATAGDERRERAIAGSLALVATRARAGGVESLAEPLAGLLLRAA